MKLRLLFFVRVAVNYVPITLQIFHSTCPVFISKLYAMSRSTDYVIYNQEKDLYDKEIFFASVA